MIKNPDKTEHFDLKVFFSCKHYVLSELLNFMLLISQTKSTNMITNIYEIKFHTCQ